MLHGGNIYEDVTRKVKLDFSVNTNPYPYPESLEEGIKKSFEEIGRYPDLEQRELRKAIAVLEGVEEKQVLGGNGASELFLGIVNHLRPKRALLINPGFYGYRHVLTARGDCEIKDYYLHEKENFELKEDVISEIKKGADLLFLTNPNNPTGRCISEKLLIKIIECCKECGCAVVVDECFLRLSSDGVSVKKLINKYEGLFVVDAFTKLFAIPGIRAGYVISNERNISFIKKQLPEWNMSVMAQTAARLCCDILINTSYQKDSAGYIKKEREYVSKALSDMGYKVFDSDTDFILLKSEVNLYEELLKRKILIRDCSSFNGLGKGFYRLAIKNHEENKELLRALMDF